MHGITVCRHTSFLAWCFLAAFLLITQNGYSQIQMVADHNFYGSSTHLLAFDCGMTKVLCRLNGQLLHEKGFEMHALYGSVAAEDCVLKPMQAISKVIVNSSSCFELSTANAGTTGRVFDGTEDVIAFVTGRYVNTCMQAAGCWT